MGEHDDVYAPYYAQLESPHPSKAGASFAGIPIDGVPTGVIVGIAVGVLVLVACVVGALRYRRWRALQDMVSQNPKSVEQNNKLNFEDDEKPRRQVLSVPSVTAYGAN